MLYLGPLYRASRESRKYMHLFYRSLRQPVYLSLQNPRMFNAARHLTFGTRRDFTEVTRQEIEDVTEAMQAARLAFLEGGGLHFSPSSGDTDMRAVLGKLSLPGGYRPIHQMNTPQVLEAVRDALIDGELIFVPEEDDLRACVKAIQEDRPKRPAPRVQSQQDNNPYATVQQMMGKPPRIPCGRDTPLSDAQPFEYLPDTVGNAEQDAASFLLSHEEKEECMEKWLEDQDICWSIGKAMGGYGTVQACIDRARYNYNICMGFTQAL